VNEALRLGVEKENSIVRSSNNEKHCHSSQKGVASCKPALGWDNDEILDVAELAVRLRVKVSWVYTHSDFLGAYRLGKYLRFSWFRVRNRLDQASSESLGSQPNDPPQH
jgi:hypothetical protein